MGNPHSLASTRDSTTILRVSRISRSLGYRSRSSIAGCIKVICEQELRQDTEETVPKGIASRLEEGSIQMRIFDNFLNNLRR